MKIGYAILFLTIFLFTGQYSQSQTIRPGKQTINKMLFSGLEISQNIPKKELAKSWETYLSKYGSVKSHKGEYTIESASVNAIATTKVQITSKISSISKDQQQIFVAFNTGSGYISGPSDAGYAGAEAFLKEFNGYAAANENARLAGVALAASQKNNKALLKKNEKLEKDIQKSQKSLVDYKNKLDQTTGGLPAAEADMNAKEKSYKSIKSSGSKEAVAAEKKNYEFSKKSYKKLSDEDKKLKKNIDKTNEKLTKLKSDLDKNRVAVQTAQTDVQTKQNAYDDAKRQLK